MVRFGVTVPFDPTPLAEYEGIYQEIAALGYSDVWTAEASGTDGFVPLALAAAWAPACVSGRASFLPSRGGRPRWRCGVATLAEAAPGRFQFGLGTSSDVIVRAVETPFPSSSRTNATGTWCGS